MVNRNDRIPLYQDDVTPFHAQIPPGIGIREYLERVQKYAGCSHECFVLALIYIDRIIQRNPGFVMSSLNVHRLMITSVMVAAKFSDDKYYGNSFYARVGGVPNCELNNLEIEFLFMINFSLHVESDEYEGYRRELQQHAAQIRFSKKAPQQHQASGSGCMNAFAPTSPYVVDQVYGGEVPAYGVDAVFGTVSGFGMDHGPRKNFPYSVDACGFPVVQIT